MSLVDDAFLNLKRKLEITATEQKVAIARHTAIRATVGEALDLEDHFLTGSYKRATKTKKLKDVDIFFVLRTGGRDASKRNLPPLEILEQLKSILDEDYEQVRIGRRCCTVIFGNEAEDEAEDVVSFDAVPAFARSGGGYDIPDKVSGKWVGTDPKIQERKATDKNALCDGKWKPFVKMVKGWNREAGGPIKPSFLIEVMALDLVETPFTTYQLEFRNFLATAEEQIGNVWADPANLGPDVNSSMDAAEKRGAAEAIKAAREIAEEAIFLENDGKYRAAIELWRKLFGWRMPRP